jgi:hypothetical protein
MPAPDFSENLREAAEASSSISGAGSPRLSLRPDDEPIMDAADLCPPLVPIEWLDSGQPVPGWQWLEEIEPRRPHLCVSVGFLVQDDATTKVLAPNLGASNGSGDWDQASGVITIPASAVQRMLTVSPRPNTSTSDRIS